MNEQPQSGPGWRTVLRDLSFLTLPWVLIFKQAGILFEPPKEVSPWIVLLAGAMLGVPGILQVWQFFSGGASGVGTPTSSSAPVESASPQQPPSSITSDGNA